MTKSTKRTVLDALGKELAQTAGLAGSRRHAELLAALKEVGAESQTEALATEEEVEARFPGALKDLKAAGFDSEAGEFEVVDGHLQFEMFNGPQRVAYRGEDGDWYDC